MLKLEKGNTYTASRVRSGSGSRGDWELVVIRPEGKARQEITIFPTNVPCGVKEGDVFSVKEISAVSVKRSKNAEGVWSGDKTSVDAVIVPFSVDDLDEIDGFEDGPFDDELEL